MVLIVVCLFGLDFVYLFCICDALGLCGLLVCCLLLVVLELLRAVRVDLI